MTLFQIKHGRKRVLSVAIPDHADCYHTLAEMGEVISSALGLYEDSKVRHQ